MPTPVLPEKENPTSTPPKRRITLPVIGQKSRPLDTVQLGNEHVGSTGDHSDTTVRPAGAWVLLGALAIFAVLVPLSMLAVPVLNLSAGRARYALVFAMALVSIAFSSASGGYLIGRFGDRVGPFHGALAGAVAGMAMWGISRTPFGGVILLITVPCAWGGTRLGKKARKPTDVG